MLTEFSCCAVTRCTSSIIHWNTWPSKRAHCFVLIVIGLEIRALTWLVVSAGSPFLLGLEGRFSQLLSSSQAGDLIDLLSIYGIEIKLN